MMKIDNFDICLISWYLEGPSHEDQAEVLLDESTWSSLLSHFVIVLCPHICFDNIVVIIFCHRCNNYSIDGSI